MLSVTPSTFIVCISKITPAPIVCHHVVLFAVLCLSRGHILVWMLSFTPISYVDLTLLYSYMVRIIRSSPCAGVVLQTEGQGTVFPSLHNLRPLKVTSRDLKDFWKKKRNIFWKNLWKFSKKIFACISSANEILVLFPLSISSYCFFYCCGKTDSLYILLILLFNHYYYLHL